MHLLGTELSELTDTELLVFAPEPESLTRMLPSWILARLLKQGRIVRILHASHRDGVGMPFAPLARAGAMVCTVAHVPHPMVVRDREVVYMPYPDPRHPMSEKMIRFRNVMVARCLAAMCDALWTAAPPTSESAAADISFDQHEILKVLSDGFTDDRAAARLHLSTRTFARRVATIMTSLDATSRFQAGVLAARRGWI